jgi:BirA family biotin operon repressor/biotin-[acetyl-CoA-carboxylase] ligase
MEPCEYRGLDTTQAMAAFDLDRLRRETFVSHVEFHQEIGSTNTRALELASEGSPFPALVLAERQTAGRGRGLNRWWAGDGALTFSLLLDTAAASVSAELWPFLSLTAGLAVAEAIDPFIQHTESQVKWPNDVFLRGRKVCGILVESVARPAGCVVIGVGLNVNNTFQHAPAELLDKAISMAEVAGAVCDRMEVLIGVLRSLADHLARVRDDREQVAAAWRARCYLDGRTVQVVTGQSSHGPDGVMGVCQGIADDGSLLVRTETGVVRCRSGVVARIL